MKSSASKVQYDHRWHDKSIPKKHWHFHRTLFERFEVVLAPSEFSQMLHDIRSDRAFKVRQLGKNKAARFVRFSRIGEWCFVLVVKDNIVTALPANESLVRARKRLAP